MASLNVSKAKSNWRLEDGTLIQGDPRVAQAQGHNVWSEVTREHISTIDESYLNFYYGSRPTATRPSQAPSATHPSMSDIVAQMSTMQNTFAKAMEAMARQPAHSQVPSGPSPLGHGFAAPLGMPQNPATAPNPYGVNIFFYMHVH